MSAFSRAARGNPSLEQIDHQLDHLATDFASVAPACDFWSLRLQVQMHEHLDMRQGVLESSDSGQSAGAMVTLVADGGIGYAATCDLSRAGLAAAARRALAWADCHRTLGLFDGALLPRSSLRAEYASPVAEPWSGVALTDKIALLEEASRALPIDARILDWSAWLGSTVVDQLFVSSAGAHVFQHQEVLHSGLVAVANAGGQTQSRHGGGADWPGQGGLERLALVGFPRDAARVAEQALALLEAPECPSDRRDLLLLPSQMALQIHESIGHPLELDRILGDERNYAGASFVTPDMFGSYRYGSDCLNVTFDPAQAGALASMAADDDGSPAQRAYLIRNGILERPLGGALSVARAGLAGTANSRASGWDRPPIDRMGNINVEPAGASLAELIGGIERGILMDTNRSWSIDDNRNKFQFSCELGRLIENGELGALVRNPGYRGISADFWRSLDGVGDADSVERRGVLNCGKGEPNQSVFVGHASPPCRFRQVEVFGGGA